MKKASMVLLMMVLVMTLTLAGCGSPDTTEESAANGDAASTETAVEPMKIIAAHNQTDPTNPYQIGLLEFKEVAEKLSDGAIEVEVHAGTLGTNENELVEKLTLGAADVVIVSPGFMTQTGIPEVDIFALPYLFDSYEHWEAVVDGDVGQQMAELILERSNNQFKILGYWTAGVRHYYGRQPLNSIEDIEGMTIRTQTSGVVADFWTQVGAIPTSVAWGELYQALQQRAVDSAENAYPYYVQQNHHRTDNGKYTTETGHDYTTRFMLINGNRFDTMSPAQQEIILEAAEASVAAERSALYAQEDEYKEKLIDEGGEVNEIDRTPFIEVAIPIQDAAATQMGVEEIIEQIRGMQ